MLLSACLIVRNEAHCLARCLASLQGLADEIVLLDTGSSDTTLEIARQYAARIFEQPWQAHYGQARNQVSALAMGQWLLQIDADEWLTPEAAQQLRQRLLELQPAIYALPWQQHPNQPASQKAVLYPNQRGVRYLGRVHELPWDPTGQLPTLSLPEVPLSHQPQVSPLDPTKVRRYQALLQQDQQHPDPLERFHALRHLAQAALILQEDAQAQQLFEQAWQLLPALPVACQPWGASVLEGLLFLACEHRHPEAYQHWRAIYAQAYPNSPKLVQLPSDWQTFSEK